ncbi:MAG: putative sulfatase [Pseudobdellovibrio sp.]|nr:putative sulfatase [Pseudobdellovibrio sp.]
MWFLAYFFLHFSVYTLVRAVFYIWNKSSLSNLQTMDVLWAFLHGWRFDLSVLSVLVGLCFLGLVWLGHIRILKNLWLGLFITLNSAFLFLNFADIELYNFTAKRFTASSFFLLSDGKASNLIAPYLTLAGTCFLTVAVYIFLAGTLAKRYNEKFELYKKAVFSFIILIVSVIASRGGFQHKPLTFVDAKLFDNSYGNNLILNSTFTVFKSATHRSLDKSTYFAADEMLSYLNARTPKTVTTGDEKLNIVILVLEGFSDEYTKLKNPEPTPFLNKLRSEGADFKSAYANGRRSIEGIAAILSGIPALMEEPFINSEFSANQIIGLGTLLTSEGYHTSFFHAANSGSMHFDSFTKSVGINNFYSKADYPNAADDDGTWGIFDEPFLKWTCDRVSGFHQPFFTTVFTLSSHQPYKLPATYIEKFKDDRLEILKTIQYTDYSLEKFFECARTKEWYGNTLFILTADHTGPEYDKTGGFVSRYRVPFVMYGPGLSWLKKLNTNQPVQQIDVLPTILDVLNIEQKNVNHLARSVLREGPKVIALYSDGHYELVGDVKNREQQLKAVQQYFSEGLYDNRLYYPAK